MTRIIAIANQKGGVGKTTTTVNLATAMAACGKKVLLIDMDPQGNASTGLGLPSSERGQTLYHVLFNECTLQEAIVETNVPKLDVLPSSVDLAAAEIELIDVQNRQFILRQALDTLQGYDVVFIDCPPSLGLLTLNAFCASQSVLVPLQCEFYALEGLSQLTKTISRVQQSVNEELALDGIVLTMYDKRNNLTLQVEDNVRDFFGETVYTTVIPRNVKISEAPSHGLPAIVYDIKAPGSVAYLQLAKEMIGREKKREKKREEEQTKEGKAA